MKSRLNHQAPPGDPRCAPIFTRPVYMAVGADDEYYGLSVPTAGFEAVASWELFSTQILGCTGGMVDAAARPALAHGKATCYDYPECNVTGSGVNRMCSVADTGHDGTLASPIINRAFDLFFQTTTTTTGSSGGGSLAASVITTSCYSVIVIAMALLS